MTAKIFGHRGALAELPENTLASFARALEQGADGVELDVALSADGVPVIMHDDTIDRTTSGTGAVSDLTLAQLREVDAGDGELIPTLDEVLQLVASHDAEVDIEIKAPESVPLVLETARRLPSLKWFASAFDWTALTELRRLDADARIYVLTDGIAFDEALSFAAEVGAEGLSIWDMGVDAERIGHIHDAGFKAFVWTVNDPEHAAELAAAGAEAFCTDSPATLLHGTS
ncbi:MAG: glycerophosphodiester phosphodiesterase family protein [Microbacterium sp.]